MFLHTIAILIPALISTIVALVGRFAQQQVRQEW